ncbi:MAG: hypothetical protein GY866_12050, partial [Proteobacteria bacterium]|nr:hypothetical protein [Pseudomonadota bacterium]
MFRIKIALLSVLISSTVLIAFGLFFLTVIGKVGMSRIDRETLALGESQLLVWHSKEHWQEFDRSLRSIYGPERWKDLIVQVTDADHRLLYRSPHWPREFTAASFPEFDLTMKTGIGPWDGDPQDRWNDDADRGNSDRPGPPPLDERPHQWLPPRLAVAGHDRAPPPPRRLDEPMNIKQPFFRTLESAAGRWRTGIMGNRHVTILLGIDLSGYYEDAARYKR